MDREECRGGSGGRAHGQCCGQAPQCLRMVSHDPKGVLFTAGLCAGTPSFRGASGWLLMCCATEGGRGGGGAADPVAAAGRWSTPCRCVTTASLVCGLSTGVVVSHSL